MTNSKDFSLDGFMEHKRGTHTSAGDIHINSAAIYFPEHSADLHCLPLYRAARLYVNRARKELAIELLPEETPGSYAINSYDNDGGACTINPRALVKNNRIATGKYRPRTETVNNRTFLVLQYKEKEGK